MKKPLVVIGLLLMSAVWLGGCSASRTIAPIVVAPNNRVEIAVTRMGFEPERVQVTHGQPVTLVVTRTTDMTCATEMVMPSHGIRRALPPELSGGGLVPLRFGRNDDVHLRHGDGVGRDRGEVKRGRGPGRREAVARPDRVRQPREMKDWQ